MNSKLFSLVSTIRIVGLLVAALAMWVFAEIAEDVLEKETHAIDRAILLGLKNLHSPPLTQFMRGITFLGEPQFLLILCAIAAAILLVRQHRLQPTTIAIAGGGAVALNYLLKLVFARNRPLLWDHVVDVRFYSFPSGHAMISLVIYGLLGYLLAIRYRRWGGWIMISTIVLILLIGISRLYLGVHWPTDIAAGYTAGLVWLITCILGLEVGRGYRDFLNPMILQNPGDQQSDHESTLE